MRDKAIIALLLLLQGILMAQRDQDAALWMNVSIEKKFTRRFSFFVSPNLRINKNFGTVNGIFSDFSAEYSLKGPFSFSLNYRQGVEQDARLRYMGFHRFYADLGYKKKLADRVTFSLRLRYQEQLGAINREEDWDISKRTFRLRYKLQPKWKKSIVPYFANEFFYRFNPENKGWNKIRLTGGAEYEFDKRKSIEVYYTMQRSAFQGGNEVDHIYGLTFNLKL
jgi:hypothetical protein